MIKISVIIPVYNVEKYLKECLDSIYTQTLKEIEVIIINDGSKDDSYKIINRYKSLYPDRTHVINKENGGLSSARNRGLEEAKGEYVSFVDSDDFIGKEMYETLYREAINNNLEVVQCLYQNYYEGDEKRNYTYKFLKKDSKILTGKEYFNLNPSVSACDKIYNRKFLEKKSFRFKDGIYAEDVLELTKLFFYIKRIKYINKIFYFYRRERLGSIVNSVNLKEAIKLFKNKYYVVNELENFRLRTKQKGNINRIIVANIVTPFLKKEMKIKEYRLILFKEFKENKCLRILFRNIKIKVMLDLIYLFCFRMVKEGKI